MGEWQDIESIPVGRAVTVRTVKGIECLASHDRRSPRGARQ